MTLLFDAFAPRFGFSRENDRHLASAGTALRPFVPAADVVGTEAAVTVVMGVPGLSAEDLEIELVDDVLTVRGERAFPYAADQGEDGAWQRVERGFGAFERVVRVPEGLDGEHIQASMADGVLTLHIAMPEARKPRRIAINAGGQQPALEEDTAASREREPVGATA